MFAAMRAAQQQIRYSTITAFTNTVTRKVVVLQKNNSDNDNQMLEIIRTVVGSPDHKDYGMFVLVIMSHGMEKGKIYGTDLSCITSEEIEDALSHTNFPAMKGKPKLIIIQACRGERQDKPDDISATKVRSDNASALPTRDMDVPDDGTSTGDEITTRNSWSVGLRDDLVVMNSSFESFISMREDTYGSIFIRALVVTFYKHAAHRHIYDLFLMVQERVRRSGEMIDNMRPGTGGQMPTCITTLTRYRKLYLFPRYHGMSLTIHHDGIEKTDDGQSYDPVESYVEYKASDLKMPTAEEDDYDDDYSDDFEDDSDDEEEIKEEINMRMATPQKKTRTLSNRR